MTDKEYCSLPRVWGIEFSNRLITINPYRSDIKQNEPVLYFENEGRQFTVEFKNQTDYKASEAGAIVSVDIINKDRRRFSGVARRALESSFKNI